MRLAWPALIVLSATGCTDLVTTEVGEGSVARIELERSVAIGARARCSPATAPIVWPGARSASVSIAPSNFAQAEAGCDVTVGATAAVVVERATVEAQAQALDGFDETSLVGIDLELVALELRDADGASLRGAVPQARVTVDGQTLFDDVNVGAHTPRPRAALPESTVAAFREALAEPRAVRADLELRFTFTDAAAIPEGLDVRLVLQPILIVDVVRAAL